jgi:L-rhamnose mutarotase
MRICFHLQIKSERLDEYRALHQAVWPEVLETLKRAGIQNYSLYLWKDGHEFGVLECPDWATTLAILDASPVMARWEAFMAEYLATPVTPGIGPTLLEEVFRLA